MNRNMRLFSVLVVFSVFLWSTTMAEKGVSEAGGAGDSSSKGAAVHIVYTEQPEGEEPEAFHLKTLSSVLGSEEAAKESLIYSYKTAASGFSAKLTPEQVAEISKQPGVLQVVPSRTYQLHSGPGKLHV
ncbi:subtilisin-like protease SBT3.11 [Telopea speciosissima]|uniref:subtilisin-like protease SBT3.11 n=1 Tax=Telopea speciosissima TaxID=54955 RepID=UPI001CC6A925|nr:subtilisin-like protease SBT3.11 [Telopea speciosissima]